MAIYHRDGFTCLHCGRKPDDENYLTLDHVDDRGGHRPENLITLCNECNGGRGDKPIEVFSPELARRAALATAKPINRDMGRALASEWLERREARAKRLKAKRTPTGSASGQ